MNSKKVELKEDEYQEIYNIFKKLSSTGKIPAFEEFKKNMDTFFQLTFDAYISNMGSKRKAFIKWVEFIGSKDIALDYFRAVDTWHAYT